MVATHERHTYGLVIVRGAHSSWLTIRAPKPGIPTEPVGSLPRSNKLQAGYADYEAGSITKDQLERLQDDAVRDSISRMEATVIAPLDVGAALPVEPGRPG